jgi:hypothetical protein
MNRETRNTDRKILILTDSEGNCYAIPRAALEGYRVTGQRKVRLQELTGDDVAGYAMDHRYARESVTAQYQAERRLEAAQRRLGEQGGQGDADAGADLPAEPEGAQNAVEAHGMFTGMLVELPDDTE